MSDQANHHNDKSDTNQLVARVRAEIEQDDRQALNRARVGIAIRGALIVFVMGYMMWVSSAVSKLDAPTLTQAAMAHFEERLPDLRAEIRDYMNTSRPRPRPRLEINGVGTVDSPTVSSRTTCPPGRTRHRAIVSLDGSSGSRTSLLLRYFVRNVGRSSIASTDSI